MSEKLSAILNPDEQVLWEGSPNKVALFEKPYPGILATRWVACAIVTALALVYWLYMPTVSSIDPSRARNIFIIILLSCAAIALSPVFSVGRLSQTVRYCITNQRFLAYKTNNDVIQYRDLADITEVTISPLPTGYANLFIGPINKSIRKRVHDNIYPYKEANKLEPMVFASIEAVDRACSKLPSHIKVNYDH
jgi:hypothetical protein